MKKNPGKPSVNPGRDELSYSRLTGSTLIVTTFHFCLIFLLESI